MGCRRASGAHACAAFSAAGRSQGALVASTRHSSTWPYLRRTHASPSPRLSPPAQVAVQLPMFNERAVCQAIIDCCAELDWPAQRLKIQVGAVHEATSAGSCPLPSPAHAAARRPPSTHLGRFGHHVPLLVRFTGAGRLDRCCDAGARGREGGWAGQSGQQRRTLPAGCFVFACFGSF